LAAVPLFAKEDKGRENESDGKALLHLGQWKFDDGGRTILSSLTVMISSASGSSMRRSKSTGFFNKKY